MREGAGATECTERLLQLPRVGGRGPQSQLMDVTALREEGGLECVERLLKLPRAGGSQGRSWALARGLQSQLMEVTALPRKVTALP